jgi:hypothetical protein
VTGDRTFKLGSDTTSEPGRYLKSLGEPRRGAGLVDSNYRNVTISSSARPYTYWMLQRSLDAYRELDAVSKSSADTALAGTGWEEVLAFEPRHRLGKQNYQLIWESPGAGSA